MPRAGTIRPRGGVAPADRVDRSEYEDSRDFLEASGALARPGDPTHYRK